MRKENLSVRQLIYWNCKEPGHSFTECPGFFAIGLGSKISPALRVQSVGKT